ncbi:putative cationic amino acid transport integral membrane protein [Nakamurella endophytica]|uniref:Cationic amino acid transport integral membrane protein n=1 Tax=Nakamurella endophytica TaxID=1748367 RepID=A0A917SUI7_9ACTN|nr:amino acid permease [Nakamurella endophytica]GGL96687.1 putative cationic amino acid transport integral membrane protein [Nakamurella endophytica]
MLSTAVPKAGPGVLVSFLIAGLAAGLSAICYAELASTIPVSGSTCSYAYATLGELAAMGIAACLLLEYGVSTAAVAVGWSGYLNTLLHDLFGFELPYALSHAPDSVSDAGVRGVVNLPAVVLIGLCALLLVRGASESAAANAVMVIVKLGVLALFVVIALTAFRAGNFSPFLPLGFSGVGAAAGTIFFSFIGLDAVSTAGEEVKDPQRTMPRAILAALGIVVVFYLLVAGAAIGAQRWTDFEGQEAGLALILQHVTGSTVPGIVLAAGAVVSIFSVTLVTLYGQTRILFAMGRDGMLPQRFARVDPRTLTPTFNTVVVAAAVAVLAALVPLSVLSDVTSIGTLAAFIVVAIGVMVLRRTAPDLPRGFRVPGYPVTRC